MGDCGEDDDPKEDFEDEEIDDDFEDVDEPGEHSDKEDNPLTKEQFKALAGGIACSQTIRQKEAAVLAAVESLLVVGREVKDFVLLIISAEEKISEYFDQDSVAVVDGDEDYVMKIVTKDSIRESLSKVDEAVAENMDSAEDLSIIVFKNGVIATFDSRDI